MEKANKVQNDDDKKKERLKRLHDLKLRQVSMI